MAAASFRFTLDPTGVKKLARGPEVTAFVNKNARRVLEQAKATPIVPRWYLASLTMEPAVAGTRDPVAKVRAGSSFWHLFEYGSVNNPPYRPLTRAVIDAGLKFEEN